MAVVTAPDQGTRPGRANGELPMFRAIVEASQEAVAVTDAAGRLVYVNPAYEKLFGCRREIFPPAALAVIEHEARPALQRGESWEGVLEVEDTNGRSFPLWQRAGVVRDGAGEPAFYFAFMHDHSGQRQADEELRRAKEAAERANHDKSRFLAAASHDLRQPLQALAMFVAVLAGREHPEAVRKLIGRIEDSLGALESLLNSLLDVSRIDAGLVVPEVEPLPVGPTLERLACEFAPEAAARRLDLRLVTSGAMIRSDGALLARILRNLLQNAIRYTERGRILLGCRRRGDRLRIEVWDTGIGIPESQLKLIFRDFHQIDNANRNRHNGLGLGLAVVDRLARLLDHRVAVASRPGKGSVFALEVPLAAPRVRRPPRQLPLAIPARRADILVIDDDPDVLDSTRLLLSAEGHHVITATDGDAALDVLLRQGITPDLVIADYRLAHGTTGGQVIARIRLRLKAAIPAIIVTGDTAPERLRQAQANGHGLLHKPVQAETLLAAIDAALAQPAARRPRGRRVVRR